MHARTTATAAVMPSMDAEIIIRRNWLPLPPNANDIANVSPSLVNIKPLTSLNDREAHLGRLALCN